METIKVNELRLGNWIRYNNIDITIDIDCLAEIKRGDKFYPIPLTEDWLLKAGFKKWKSNDKFYQKEDIVLEYFNNIYFISFNGRFIEIKYLHILQNLYFVLTGKELEFK